jgi:O-antigen/teichoic acid export membrane protein
MSLGSLHTIGAVAVGLWLTPFLLRTLGSHDYGLWLLGAQAVLYLGLTDLGVVALVPRDVAAASGVGAGDRQAAIQTTVAQVMRLTLMQMPLVVAMAAAVLWWLPRDWEALRGPLGVILLGFVLAFPFRVLLATLQGLQDLAFVGTIQITAWLAGVAATIAGALAGMGLYALSAGWVTTQVVTVAMAGRRLVRTFPDVLPRRLQRIPLLAMRDRIGRGGWVTLEQVAQLLLSGTEIVVIGRLLGPAAVVPYACTAKLMTLLANQPQMLMQLALPALSELRSSAPRARLAEISQAMSLGLLIASGAIVAVVFTVNEAFVTWWVGGAQYGGAALTVALLAAMLVRHFNVTTVYALFCYGNERRLALTSIADGAVGLLAMLLLVPRYGLLGAAVASLLSTGLVSLPSNLRALARDEATSPLARVALLAPWLIRLVLFVTGLAALFVVTSLSGPWAAASAAGAVGIAYLAVMWPVLRTPPLGPLLTSTLAPWITTVPGLGRRLPRPLVHSR